MIKLTVKGLAKYMTAGPAAQRKVLQDFKFPKEDEPTAMRLFYKDALNQIKVFHKNNYEKAWLIQKADDLFQLAQNSSGRTQERLRSNSKALHNYAEHFSNRHFSILEGLRFSLNFSNVQISIVPDLHVIEQSKEKLVKLDFTKTSSDPKAIKIISQCMYEAALKGFANLTSSSVLYFDVPKGKEHRGARVGARTLREIEAACETISALWETIKPPKRKA